MTSGHPLQHVSCGNLDQKCISLGVAPASNVLGLNCLNVYTHYTQFCTAPCGQLPHCIYSEESGLAQAWSTELHSAVASFLIVFIVHMAISLLWGGAPIRSVTCRVPRNVGHAARNATNRSAYDFDRDTPIRYIRHKRHIRPIVKNQQVYDNRSKNS